MRKKRLLFLSGEAFWQTILFLMQAVTGLFLSCFLFIHFLGVSMIWSGAGSFNWYTAHLDKNNFFIKAAVFLIFGIFLAHAVNGFRIVYNYFLKTPKVHKYLIDTNYRGSWLWYAHFLSGVCVFALGIFHLSVACRGHNITTAAMAAGHLRNSFYFWSLAALLFLASTHSLCGIRNIIIKYGILPENSRLFNLILIGGGVAVLSFGIVNILLLLKA